MALPVPNLDDRRFQDLVDDAKRLVQQRCPEWTDHNVSDPGVTLIETFAWMTDQLLYRLNRVPDRNYVKFLELIGVSLFPPTAARSRRDVLAVGAAAGRRHGSRPGRRSRPSGPRPTRRSSSPPIDDLPIVPSSLAELGSMIDGKTLPRPLERAREGHRLLLLQGRAQSRRRAATSGCRRRSRRTPSGCASAATSRASASTPTNPPLAWEAWNGDDWEPCELDSDSTGGLNRDGDVVLHVPNGHVASLIAKQRAGWLRARVHRADRGPAGVQRVADRSRASPRSRSAARSRR